jgi:hypothetical protein
LATTCELHSPDAHIHELPALSPAHSRPPPEPPNSRNPGARFREPPSPSRPLTPGSFLSYRTPDTWRPHPRTPGFCCPLTLRFPVGSGHPLRWRARFLPPSQASRNGLEKSNSKFFIHPQERTGYPHVGARYPPVVHRFIHTHRPEQRVQRRYGITVRVDHSSRVEPSGSNVAIILLSRLTAKAGPPRSDTLGPPPA